MKNLMNLFESKRTFIGMLVLGGLIYTSYSIQESSNKLKKVTNLESGIQTCFTRVNQSYTANILGDSAAAYLTQNFQNLTEECFAEGILSVENGLKNDLPNVAKLLSNLASNVHWFHEDVLAPVNSLAKNGEGRDVGSRFEKIETTKDQILESTDQFKGQLHNKLNQNKSLFAVFATLLTVLMFGEYMNITRRRLSNSAREKEAFAELMTENSGATSVKAGEIIKTALEQNSLIHCARLFTNFHQHTLIDRNKSKISSEVLVTPEQLKSVLSKTENLSATLDKIWEDDSIGVSADTKGSKNLEDVNLEQVSSQTVDILAEKLFSQGVQLDVNMAENLTIKSRQEDLEQSLFHLLTYAINSAHSETSEKSVSLFAHKLGDVIALDLVYSGLGFDEAILKSRVGLLNEGAANLDVDLQIAQSLLQDMDAKIQLDNKLNQNGQIIGGRIKIIFKTGKTTVKEQQNGKLVDLKVGSKKEILAAMKEA